MSGVRRRELIGGAAGLAGWAALPAEARTAPRAGRPIAIVDPAHDAAAAFGAAAMRLGAKVRPVTGDRVRFARALLEGAGGTGRIVGLTSYADFVQLAGDAAEAGWRVAGHGLHGASGHRCAGSLVPSAATLTASGSGWPAALAEVLLRRVASGATAVRIGRGEPAALVSWELVRRA